MQKFQNKKIPRRKLANCVCVFWYIWRFFFGSIMTLLKNILRATTVITECEVLGIVIGCIGHNLTILTVLFAKHVVSNIVFSLLELHSSHGGCQFPRLDANLGSQGLQQCDQQGQNVVGEGEGHREWLEWVLKWWQGIKMVELSWCR